MNRRLLRGAAAILLSLCLLASCGPAFPLTRSAAEAVRFGKLSEECGVDLVHGVRLKGRLTDEDTHGGFLGDGERLTRYRYDGFRYGEDSVILADTLADAPRWRPLPFGEELAGWCAGIGGLELLPEEWPGNGYYCFFDRQAERWDPEGEAAAFQRPSLNFTLFVYDTDTDVLTVYELDT